jgi:hypothetical protein
MGSCRRAALGSIEEGGQALELDLQKVRRQEDSYRGTHALDYGAAQMRVGLPPTGGQRAA